MLLNEDQLAIQEIVANISKKVIAPKAAYYDETEGFPWENVKTLGDGCTRKFIGVRDGYGL